jgi:hypothetical protein
MDEFLITGMYDRTEFSVRAKDSDDLDRLVALLGKYPSVVKFQVWKSVYFWE